MATIVLVQGSFQTPTFYEKLGEGLKASGHPTVHPQLPSCSDPDNPEFPTVTLIDDALAVRLELIRQVEYEGKTVVVVMHSYGGLVGSEAIPEELSYANRQSRQLPGGVIHLFYFCAFMLEEGQSVLSAFGESPNNDVRVSVLNLALDKKDDAYSLASLTVASTLSMVSRNYITIFRRPKHHCGPHASYRSPTKYKPRRSPVPLGVIFLQPTSSPRMIKLYLLNTRKLLQRKPNPKSRNAARDTPPC